MPRSMESTVVMIGYVFKSAGEYNMVVGSEQLIIQVDKWTSPMGSTCICAVLQHQTTLRCMSIRWCQHTCGRGLMWESSSNGKNTLASSSWRVVRSCKYHPGRVKSFCKVRRSQMIDLAPTTSSFFCLQYNTPKDLPLSSFGCHYLSIFVSFHLSLSLSPTPSTCPVISRFWSVIQPVCLSV